MIFHHFGLHRVKLPQSVNLPCACGTSKDLASSIGSVGSPVKTYMHLIAVDRLVYREIQLIALTLMTSRKARTPELRMITRDSC